MKIIILSFFITIGLWAESTALFGTVVNVAQNDTLNVRIKPNYKAGKIAELPPGAFVGIEKCKKIKRSVWCRVYPLVQQWYEEFEDNSHKGWANARYIQFSNRGYVLIKGKKNCAYALKCNAGKCEIVDDYEYNNVIDYKRRGLRAKWIEREYLRGESNFGATPDNIDGFCNTGMFIEEYLKNIKPTITDDAYSKINSKKISLSYPSFMYASIGTNEKVTISHSMKLEHYSGSDMRDNRELLLQRTLFNYSFSVFDTLKKALLTTFPYYKKSEWVKIMNYNSKTDWFTNVKSNTFVTADHFYGKKAYRIMIGAEGSGILYHIYRQNGKVVLASTTFDSNPPINPKNGKIIDGKWSLADEKKIIKHLVSHLKVIVDK